MPNKELDLPSMHMRGFGSRLCRKRRQLEVRAYTACGVVDYTDIFFWATTIQTLVCTNTYELRSCLYIYIYIYCIIIIIFF